MSKRLLFVTVLVLTVGFFTSAFAFAQEASQPQLSRPTLSRAEAVALLLNADNGSIDRVRWFAGHMPPLPLFSDVDQTQWYAPYLEAAFENGLIEGNADLLFRPDSPLNQEEAITLAMRYKKIAGPDTGVYLTIPTAQGNRLNKIISEAQANNIALPFPVRPEQPVTEAVFHDMIASAGVQNPEMLTIANIPVTTQFRMVASADPVSQPVNPVNAGNPLTADLLSPPVTDNAANTYFAISMPALGVNDLVITHPTDLSHNGLLAPLKTGVGHLFSYPGQGGKILVYGHSSSYPWDVSEYAKIFRQINKLAIGDKVYVNYHGTLYTYQVTHKQTVNANDTNAYAQEGKEELILYTCWPPDSVKQRYLVHADLVEVVAQK